MSDIIQDWPAWNGNTTTSGFRAFREADDTPERVTDQGRRLFLRSCGLVRDARPEELAEGSDAAASETNMASLEAFAADLGLSPHVAAAREELSKAFEATEGRPTLRSLRLRLGLSQKELASRLETSQPRIAELEAGKQSMSLSFARRMASVLQVSLDEFGTAAESVSRG